MAINHKNFAQTTLGAAIESVDGTSITVTSEAGFPSVDFIISIDTEAMLVTNVSTTTWTVTRGYEGSTAATHTNGTAIYHDWSAAEADSTVHGPASVTDAHLALYDGTTGKLIKDGGACTAAGLALLDDANAAAQLVTLGALPLAGGTMSGTLIMDNMDITLVKLLTLHGEIDDGNSSTAGTIDWNTGTAHKSTLTGNVTLTFNGDVYLVPDMTSNTAPSGVVSNGKSQAIAWNAFDRDETTYGSGFTLDADTYVRYDCGAGVTIAPTKYKIAFHSTAYQWTAWKVQGSIDGVAWNDMDSVTGANIGSTLTTYAIDAPAAYRYWQILPSAGTATIYLRSFDLMSGIVDPPAPCFLTLKLVQDGTGGRTVTWPATVKGSPIINQAPSTTSNILFYWDGTNYYTLNGLPWVTAPASSGAAGFVGQMAYDASYLYVCTAANTWERAAVATW